MFHSNISAGHQPKLMPEIRKVSLEVNLFKGPILQSWHPFPPKNMRKKKCVSDRIGFILLLKIAIVFLPVDKILIWWKHQLQHRIVVAKYTNYTIFKVLLKVGLGLHNKIWPFFYEVSIARSTKMFPKTSSHWTEKRSIHLGDNIVFGEE